MSLKIIITKVNNFREITLSMEIYHFLLLVNYVKTFILILHEI